MGNLLKSRLFFLLFSSSLLFFLSIFPSSFLDDACAPASKTRPLCSHSRCNWTSFRCCFASTTTPTKHFWLFGFFWFYVFTAWSASELSICLLGLGGCCADRQGLPGMRRRNVHCCWYKVWSKSSWMTSYSWTWSWSKRPITRPSEFWFDQRQHSSPPWTLLAPDINSHSCQWANRARREARGLPARNLRQNHPLWDSLLFQWFGCSRYSFSFFVQNATVMLLLFVNDQ